MTLRSKKRKRPESVIQSSFPLVCVRIHAQLMNEALQKQLSEDICGGSEVTVAYTLHRERFMTPSAHLLI